MADIFISYARSTAAQAQRIAQALRALGYGVWRDDELPAHRSYAEVIEERLKAAKAVVVIWSAEAVRSEWVQSEADRARNDRKLVQLTVDGAAPPMPFDRIQCADLNGWSGDLTAPGWRKVIASIADLVGGAAPLKAPNAQSERVGVSICVLPFANMSNDPEQEYFADGISEDIITDLSKVSALAVVARNTAFTFKGKSVDIKQVARQIGVTHVLEGSVRKSGKRVRITAQLIDGATGNHLWAERYDRDLDDIFALQDEISEAIVAALRVNLLPEEKKAIEDRGTNNLEAYDKYLRARALHDQGGEGLTRAMALLREAVALDPGFVPAWVYLYSALLNYSFWAPERRIETLDEMAAINERVVAMAPNEPVGMAARWGQVYFQGDILQAERFLEAANEKLPQRAAPLGFLASFEFARGVMALDTGRPEEAVREFQQGVRQDPLSLMLSGMLQFALQIAGRLTEAQAEYERSLDLAGNRNVIELPAFMRMRNGMTREQIAAQWQRVIAAGGPFVQLHRDLAGLLDDSSAALLVVRRFFDGPTHGNPASQLVLSLYAGLFGDAELVLSALRRTYVDFGLPFKRFLWMPSAAEARKDPRFKQLVRDLGIADYWRRSGKWGDFARPLGDDDFEIIR
ncbi:MAG: TIR domain-containing protein [Alphaproteobacteria bacterium]